MKIQSGNDVISHILDEIQIEGHSEGNGTDTYAKTYNECYNKEDYSRGYVRYSEAIPGHPTPIPSSAINEIRPELDRLIMDKLRGKKDEIESVDT